MQYIPITQNSLNKTMNYKKQKADLETMAAIAPAHKCLVVFIALPPLIPTCSVLVSSTTASSEPSSPFCKPSSPFCTKHPLESRTTPSLFKLTDKNPPPATALSLNPYDEPDPETTAEEDFRNDTTELSRELETVGSKNKPPMMKRLEFGSSILCVGMGLNRFWVLWAVAVVVFVRVCLDCGVAEFEGLECEWEEEGLVKMADLAALLPSPNMHSTIQFPPIQYTMLILSFLIYLFFLLSISR